MELTKHACMLPKPLDYPEELHPTANYWQRVRSRWRNLLLPCDWHYGTIVFIRSRKALKLERQRQLATGHWFIWHPYSPAKFYFDSLVYVIHFAGGLYLPTQVFLHCPNPGNPYILAIDFLMFFDIIITFCSGYQDEDNKEIILDPKKIALKYFKSSFVIDLISVVPWQLYQPFSDCRYPSHTVFYPIKLLRYRAMTKKRDAILEQIEAPYFCSVIWMVLVKIVFFFNWMTYLQYQLPAICIHYYDLNNLGLAEDTWLKRLAVDPEIDPFEKYITNLYCLCARCVGSGYAIPVKSHVIPEMIEICFTSLISVLFLIFCFVTVLRLVLCMKSNFIYDGAMKNLEKYMNFKRLPKSLQNKIRLFVNYKFGGNYMDENYILGTIQEHIKQDINMHTCRRLVVTVPLFKGFPMTLINTIIFSLKLKVYVPEQDVIKLGELNDSMYFIYYGTVAVISDGKQVKRLNDGAYFNEKALLGPYERAKVTVTALEITEIYTLSNEDFKACVRLYPHIEESLLEKHHRSVSRIFPGRP